MPFGSFVGGTGGAVPVPNTLVLDPPVAATITLAALASGAARQSSYVTNSLNRQAAKVTVEITTAAVAPVGGTIVEVWLLRSKSQLLAGLIGDDNTGPADAAYPVPPTRPFNATMIGAITVGANASTVFRGTFDSGPAGPLGDFWGIAISNRMDQPIAAGTVTYETY